MFKLDLKTRLSHHSQLTPLQSKDDYYFIHGFTIATKDQQFINIVKNQQYFNKKSYEKRFNSIVDNEKLSIKDKTLLTNYIKEQPNKSIFILKGGSLDRIARKKEAIKSKLKYLKKRGFTTIYISDESNFLDIENILNNARMLDIMDSKDNNKYNQIDSIYSNDNKKTRLLIYKLSKAGLNYQQISRIVNKDYHKVKDVIHNNSIHFIDKKRVSIKCKEYIKKIKGFLKDDYFKELTLKEKIEYLHTKGVNIKKSMYYNYVNDIKEAEKALKDGFKISNIAYDNLYLDHKIENYNKNTYENYINPALERIKDGYFYSFFKLDNS